MPCVCACVSVFFLSYLINLPLAWSTISQYNHRSQLLSLQPSFPNRKISSVFELRLNWWCSFWSKVPFNQNKITRIVTPSTWKKKTARERLSMGKRRNQDSPMIVLSQGPTGPFPVPLLLLMPCWDWRCCATVTKALGYLP